ncbi:FMN reductase [Microbacterium barkeri]|uniref:FMN reductase n=1 Tax=Microbacterium barkeri TaxID=33917 RepID=A0A9W6H0D6_9MICO|nr:FMN reductase [Microbacterium barkeri]MDR6876154.1 FMN reductase [Microbacterium barkeri]GLJ60271.1 FMN reductase [Microbacterium barkeri]
MVTVSLVAVSGSLQSPSRSSVLARDILTAYADALGDEHLVTTDVIELSELGREFSGALRRDELSVRAEEALRRIESASLLVVASPVYRASFTGLFKHVFDFVDQYALVDTPVQLAATGGSDRHALALEHQFRPLFAFFQSLTLPLAVYARDTDFTDGRIASAALRDRLELTVRRGLPSVRAALATSSPVAAGV